MSHRKNLNDLNSATQLLMLLAGGVTFYDLAVIVAALFIK